MSTHLDIQVVHASSNTFMPANDAKEDIENLLKLGAVIITLTEIGDAATFAAVKAAIKGHPYKAVNPDKGDIAFLVHTDAKIIDSGGPVAIPGTAHIDAGHGGHGPRCNSWVHVEYKGEVIFFNGVHFVVAKPDEAPHMNRRDQQNKQAKLMGAQMSKQASGRHLAIGSGDLNASLPHQKPLQDIFDSYGLTTTQHETGNTQTTHGTSRLDYIWTSDKDGRVSVPSMVVLKSKKFNSDHDPVVARLRIRQ